MAISDLVKDPSRLMTALDFEVRIGGKYIVRSMETNKNTGRVIINLFELRTEKGEES